MLQQNKSLFTEEFKAEWIKLASGDDYPQICKADLESNETK